MTGHKIARGLVPPTCPEVDEAFKECIRVVKERGIELLREALESVCDEKLELEEEKEDLEKKVEQLEDKVKDLEQEIGELRRQLGMYE
jgi:chaperonin cofactor prefoldin